MWTGRLRGLGGVGLALVTAGCASLLGIDGFDDQGEDAGGAPGAGGSTGGTGGTGGGTGGTAGGETGGAGGAGAGLRVFVTAEVYRGGLQGVVGADEKCVAAASVGAQTHGTSAWRAWLSGADGNLLPDRFARDGRWARLDGAVAFESRFRLFDGTGPTHPIAIDQHGSDLGSGGGAAEVWTGTTASGQRHQDRCDEWTHNGSDHRGRQGSFRSTDEAWTADVSNWCWHQARLYCFELPE